jgi:hypothetical protein
LRPMVMMSRFAFIVGSLPSLLTAFMKGQVECHDGRSGLGRGNAPEFAD